MDIIYGVEGKANGAWCCDVSVVIIGGFSRGLSLWVSHGGFSICQGRRYRISFACIYFGKGNFSLVNSLKDIEIKSIFEDLYMLQFGVGVAYIWYRRATSATMLLLRYFQNMGRRSCPYM